jgi:cobalt-zinc-cadmium efflux system membrane fusion protein
MRTTVTLTFLALASLATGCGHERASIPEPDPQVVGERITFPSQAPQLASLAVEPVTEESASTTRLFGRLVWDENATVRVFTPFAGRVTRVLADAGQAVSAGAPLAEVESPDFGQVQAEARSAESDFGLAESSRARLHDLFEHGAAAQKDLEAAEADRARAESQRSRALARLAAYGAAGDSVDGVFILRSPISGTIVERNLTPGQEIRPDQMLANAPQLFSPLFVLSDPSRLWIQIDATEADLSCLRPGVTFRFASSAFPARTFVGRLDHVSESVDPATHTIRARGSVDNRDRRLKAEMFVTVAVPTRPASGLRIPSRAVFLKGDRHYVFVEEKPGTFVRHEIHISADHETHVLVADGVRRGDRVVTDGCVLLEQLLD